MITSVIFDLNGTVLSDEDEYGEAFKKVLKKLGVEASDFPHTPGIGTKDNWPKLIAKYGIETDLSISELAQMTQDEYIRFIDRVTLTKGFVEFVKRLKAEKFKTALATSNTQEVVDVVLKKFSLNDYFDVAITGDEVVKNKPNPEIFTKIAKKLDVEAKECLVFEDSDSGIMAAQAAFMKVYRITSLDTTVHKLKSFKDFTQVKMEDILDA